MSATRRSTSQGGGDAGGTLVPITLGLFVVITALAVVQIKNEHRRLTVKAEALRVDNERLDLEWAQLQLEEATLAQQARIEPIARAQFSLVEPSAYQIIEAERHDGAAAAAAGLARVARRNRRLLCTSSPAERGPAPSSQSAAQGFRAGRRHHTPRSGTAVFPDSVIHSRWAHGA